MNKRHIVKIYGSAVLGPEDVNEVVEPITDEEFDILVGSNGDSAFIATFIKVKERAEARLGYAIEVSDWDAE